MRGTGNGWMDGWDPIQVVVEVLEEVVVAAAVVAEVVEVVLTLVIIWSNLCRSRLWPEVRTWSGPWRVSATPCSRNFREVCAPRSASRKS